MSIAAAFAAAIIITALVMAAVQIKPAIVVSGSMEPAIHTGSLVLIDAKDALPEKGDIIAFRRGDAFVVHRVCGMSGNDYLTKGDANKFRDPGTVCQDQIVGKTLFSIPRAGYVLRMFQGKRK